MAIRIAINGFGRMGRLAFREAWDWPELDIVHVNEHAGAADIAAHLLNFDSVHGTWKYEASATDNSLIVEGKTISYSTNTRLEDTPWADLGVDMVVECSGAFKTSAQLDYYLQQGIKKVVVSAPVKDGPLNIVMGVNDNLYDPQQHQIVTAASCTTNCIAPVVKVIHETFGIKHGCITTLHDITNTQRIIDQYHQDFRRARSSGKSLIPTTTGSATAITHIFPELKGKLNGIAVRVPLTNASITDCVFELNDSTSAELVNMALKDYSQSSLKGILGYEERPLVSCDYTNDKRSSIVDALSTMVIDNTQLKILTWYDNEMGYVNRMMELVKKVALSL